MDYNHYIQKAFRQTVHDILADVAQNGIETGCAYYLSFETNREDVVLPDFVKAKYPTEITLVLENQFENLSVNDSKIEVDLAFGGVYTTVQIPFIALKQFADPNHQFGLTLKPEKAKKEVQNSACKIYSLDELRNQKKS